MNSNFIVTRIRVLWLASLLCAVFVTGTTQSQAAFWLAWEDKNIATLSDDNTGSSFALSDVISTADGMPALQVMPGGQADETKLALPVSGADLAAWTTHNQLHLEIFLPVTSSLNPNMFFLGMADVSSQWTWVDGVFGAVSIGTGWNVISYPLSAALRNINPQGQYILYLSFFYDAGGKQSLTDPFYLGHAYFDVPYAQWHSNQQEVDDLLMMADPDLLDAVARASFDYFWQEANPENGLIKDRSTPASPASIAAVGFGLAAIPIGIDRGWISYEQGYERALITVQTFANGGVQGEYGFYYHFVDMNTGARVWDSELSSIDTALFIAGALTAGQYFDDTDVQMLAQQLYEQVDWQWMMNNRNMVSMGWKPEEGFLRSSWDHFDESVLLYVLAIASPTYPAPVSMWAAMDRPVNVRGEYIYLPGEPLFVYQYPLAFLDLRNKEDGFANYFNNAIRACERNREFSMARAGDFATYQNGVWGISASDGPNGYRAYGAANSNHDGTIAPYASLACLPFTPEISLESMRAMLAVYDVQVWGEYGFVSAINAQQEWYSTDHIGIDQGDILLMIANYQDGFVWNLFMQNASIQQTLADIGFIESHDDYAVTPAYLETFR